MAAFSRYIGIDYSGAETPEASLKGLRVYCAVGESAANIRKHANDVLRLSQLLAPDVRIEVAPRIAQDLNRLLDGIEADRTFDPKSLGINSSVAEMVERIAQAYGSRDWCHAARVRPVPTPTFRWPARCRSHCCRCWHSPES